MTLTAALLMMLEPGPVAPINQISLSVVDRDRPDGRRSLFNTAEPLAWSGIVIHDSRSLSGSLQSLNAAFEAAGRGGLGYHFVINNGQGGPDGRIDAGFRWLNQLVGDYATGPHAELFNRRAIGVCLVGDFDRQPPTEQQVGMLVDLVRELQARFDIPPEHIYTPPADQDRGLLFPEAAFRQQLLEG